MPDIEDLIRNIDPARNADLPTSGSTEALRIYREATSGSSPSEWCTRLRSSHQPE
jgi:hypothetical protein